MSFRTQAPSAAVTAFRTEVMKVMQKYSANLSSQEILAVLAYSTGQALALQDQRVPTEKFLAMIGHNIEAGNQFVVNALGEGASFNDLPV
jgi:Na+/serine symporter